MFAGNEVAFSEDLLVAGNQCMMELSRCLQGHFASHCHQVASFILKQLEEDELGSQRHASSIVQLLLQVSRASEGGAFIKSWSHLNCVLMYVFGVCVCVLMAVAGGRPSVSHSFSVYSEYILSGVSHPHAQIYGFRESESFSVCLSLSVSLSLSAFMMPVSWLSCIVAESANQVVQQLFGHQKHSSTRQHVQVGFILKCKKLKHKLITMQ